MWRRTHEIVRAVRVISWFKRNKFNYFSSFYHVKSYNQLLLVPNKCYKSVYMYSSKVWDFFAVPNVKGNLVFFFVVSVSLFKQFLCCLCDIYFIVLVHVGQYFFAIFVFSRDQSIHNWLGTDFHGYELITSVTSCGMKRQPRFMSSLHPLSPIYLWGCLMSGFIV